jgi:hypothetical protein
MRRGGKLMKHQNYKLCINSTQIEIKGRITPVATHLADFQGLQYNLFEILPNLYSGDMYPSCFIPARCIPASIADEPVMKVIEIYLFDRRDNPYKHNVPEDICLYYTKAAAERTGYPFSTEQGFFNTHF